MKKIVNFAIYTVLYVVCCFCIATCYQSYAQTNTKIQTHIHSHNESHLNHTHNSTTQETDKTAITQAEILAPQAENNLQYKFLENKNQWDKTVKFRSHVPSGMLYFKENSLLYSFVDATYFKDSHGAKSNQKQNNTLKGHGVEVVFLGANEHPSIETTDQTPEYYNFFLGNEPEKWASEVHSYTKLAYKNLYKDIDMRFYTQDEALKYEFIVAPHTDTKQIQLQYNGADKVEIENGNLKITTSVHNFVEQHPYCYQEIDGQKVEVPAKFVLKENVLSYEFPQGYNPAYTLVIDPTLVFSSYSGSISDNWGFSAAFDAAGNLYAGGITAGQQIPLLIGAFDATFNGNWDIALFKFNTSGTTLLYGTFLGGQRAEVPSSIIVNDAGNLVIMGSTGSANFPVTAAAFDNTFNGGASKNLHNLDYTNGADIFVSILNSAGTALTASTFVGGNGNDGLGNESVAGGAQFPLTQNYGDEFRGDVGFDGAGNIYVCTVTRSTNFPVTSGAALGQQDGVILSLNTNLSALRWSFYVGGSQDDAAFNLKVANNGDVFICGGTFSTNFLTTAGAFQPTALGNVEGFVQRYNSAGALQNSTFISSTNYDVAFMLDLDFATNDVYIFGNTTGTHPISAGVFNRVGGGHFLYKLNSTLSTRIWSTQLGVTNLRRPNITPTAFMVNDCGNIYFSGWGGFTNIGTTGVSLTTSGLPTTADAIRQTTDGDDFYLAILGRNAQSLVYGTFFGGQTAADGDHVDGGTSRFNRNGVIYHAVCACRSNAIPVTPGAWSTVNTGAISPPAPYSGCNNAAFKIDLDPLTVNFQPVNAATNQPIPNGFCVPVTVRLQNLSRNATVFQWNMGTFGTSTANEPPVFTITQAGTYTFRLTVSNPDLCLPPITVTRTITVGGGALTVTPNATICSGQSVNLLVSGGTNYTWSPATGLSATNIPNPVASPTQTTTYTVTSQVSATCSPTATVTVTVSPSIEPIFEILDSDLCSEFPLITLRNQSAMGGTYTWDFGNGQTSNLYAPPPFRYTNAGTYTIKLTTNAGSECARVLEKPVTVQQNTNVIRPTVSPNRSICLGQSAQLTASGGSIYAWTPATGLNSANIANPIATPTTTTIYSVRISNATQTCFRDTSVTVTVSPSTTPRFRATLSSDCDLFPLVTLTNQSVGALTYLWNFGNGQTSTLENPPPFRYTTAGTYRIILTATNVSCSRNDTVTVQIAENAANNFIKDITLAPTQRICVGDVAQLFATGGASYLWTPATGLSSTTIANPRANPTETTRYTVRIANQTGCFKDTSILVDVAPRIVLDFDITLEELCEPYPLVRIISRVSGADTYLWDFGNGQTFSGQQPPPFKYTVDGNYTISVRGTNRNCQKQESKQTLQTRIIANDFYRQIRISPRNTTVCNTDAVQLNAIGGFRYVWTPATGLSNANIGNPIARPNATTTYNVRIFNERGCAVDSAVTIEVVPDVQPDFELQVSSECGKNGVVKFVNKSTGSGQYKWFLGDGRTFDSQNIEEKSYEKTGEYEVILEVFNGVCRRTKSQKITVENVIPPNVITPNGDGKNDRFVVDNARTGWKIEIYDRWGKQIFKSDDYQNDWGNGTSNALYYYLLTSPEGKTCKGWVLVARGND
jgi:gliding motility-associated-like protein